MIKHSDCRHNWLYYQIGPFEYIYRRCLICDRHEHLELPMYVWKYMRTTAENEEYYKGLGLL